MKKIILILLATSYFCPSYCQTTSLSDLQTPVSPGFIIADQTPSSVNRPTNTKGLVASVLSLNSGGAIEFAPYWLIKSKSRRELDFEKYTSLRMPIIQTASVSATSLRSDSTLKLSVGLRMMPIRIYGGEISEKIEEIGKLLEADNLDLKALEKARDDLRKIKPVFLFEVAGAWLGTSRSGSFGELQTGRLGAWGNFCWRPIPGMNVIALVRYTNDSPVQEIVKSANLMDFGGSLGYEGNERFTFNVEYVFRKDYLVEKNYHRIVGVANFKISDNFYAVGSFGKNFSHVQNITALFGINVGLSSESLKSK